MTSTIILDPIYVDSAHIGRFVTDRRKPHEYYHQPSLPVHISDQEAELYESFCQRSASTSLIAKLSKFVSTALAHNSEGAKDIRALVVQTRALDNSGKWFEDACKDLETRDWIQNSLKKGRAIYMIAGHCILEKAHLVSTEGKDNLGSAVAQIPVATPLAAIASTLDIQTRASHESHYDKRSDVRFHDDVVYAVQYRKLTHKWFSSKTVENTELNGSSWTVVAAFRGGDKADEEYVLQVKLAEDEEDDEEEDDDDDSEEDDEEEGEEDKE